ncbi:hypothetical protein NLG97_g9682 [Lecanicillium saksenae]|uniref:Uncharacterized protein n=1 Tax=Lecanicillium saksenae TaxID=468837 RepID=A0ACC1QHB5_9HYPO|nr:hypothetical protein NLG97_g9682 [Lecanicillium saksenae]
MCLILIPKGLFDLANVCQQLNDRRLPEPSKALVASPCPCKSVVPLTPHESIDVSSLTVTVTVTAPIAMACPDTQVVDDQASTSPLPIHHTMPHVRIRFES